MTIRDRLEAGFFSVAEASELLGIGLTTTFALIKTGALESKKLGRARRIPGTAIARLLEQGVPVITRKS